MKLLCLFVLSLSLIIVSPIAFAGISTNGSVLTLEENNVWFLGSKPIEYCIENNNRVPTTKIREIVRTSIRQWQQFFKKYELDKKEFQNLAGFRNLKVALQMHEVATCTKPSEQLRFLFGVETNEVFQALAKDEGALALATRGDYDHVTYRNGGQIYVGSFENDAVKIHQMVLHELGHIFGMAHDSVSVMDSRLAYQILERRSPPPSFGVIETPRWPYRALAN